MLQSEQVEELLCVVSSLDRTELARQFLSFRASFPVDFSPEFLQSVPVDRLRHIFVALCMQQQHIPDLMAGAAA